MNDPLASILRKIVDDEHTILHPPDAGEAASLGMPGLDDGPSRWIDLTPEEYRALRDVLEYDAPPAEHKAELGFDGILRCKVCEEAAYQRLAWNPQRTHDTPKT